MQENPKWTDYRVSLKDRIVEKAFQLFTQQGIRAVKMDDIAHSLSISKRTLYE
ncbi:MAG: TetR/AcrR family transcriptional regulator, partial [Prevotella sp.]|nr:TetR/AcrR family transcriptional regulator [Prevotella sp.]